MRFYAWLDRLPLPGGYTGKFFLVAFLGVHVPLLAAVGWALRGAAVDWGMLGVLLAATLAGTAAALMGLYALLAPVRQTTAALADYGESGTVPGLPVNHSDMAGRLMAATQQSLAGLDSALTAARGAQHDAVEAMRRRERALAEVTHELRTPLNAVLGFAELLQMQAHGPLGHPRYAEFADDIAAGGQHMLSLVEGMQRYAAAQSGKVSLDVRPVGLARLVQRAARLMHADAGARSMVITTSIAPDLAVQTDERSLMQILLNLIGNAVKYAGQGARIAVSAERQGDVAAVEVSDNGAGMSPEELALAMEPFGRAPRARRDGTQGTGLGLPLVKTLAELQGGSFRLESAPGRGTTARITLAAA